MRFYEVTLSGRVNNYFAYQDATVKVKLKAHYVLEACEQARSNFNKVMINIKIVSCKEIVV